MTMVTPCSRCRTPIARALRRAEAAIEADCHFVDCPAQAPTLLFVASCGIQYFASSCLPIDNRQSHAVSRG